MFLFLIFFIGLPGLYKAQTNCTTDNGGCQHYCIDRDDGQNALCACQCYYTLDADGTSCGASIPCDVDILWMTDFSTGLLLDCQTIRILPSLANDLTPFEEWRDAVAQYFNVFNNELTNSDYAIGTMVSGSNLLVTNNFGAVTSSSTLESETMAIGSTNICGITNVFDGLFKSFNHEDQPITVLAPENARSGDTTTRVAVIAMITPLGSSFDLILDKYQQAIYGYYDQVFVIGKSDVSQLSGEAIIRIDPQLRLLACSDSESADCRYLFYTDQANDDGIYFNNTGTVANMVDRTACIARKPSTIHSITCDTTSATITIPMCRLGGLTKDDMTLNEVSCTGATHAVVSGDNVVFTVPYDDCSWATSTSSSGGATYLTLTQNIVPKTYANSGDSLKGLDFDSSCSFLRYTEEELGILNPIISEASGSAEANGTIDFELLIYTNSSYDTAYDVAEFPLGLMVLDTVYFAASATIPSNVKIILKDFVATSTPDRDTAPESYTLLENQCKIDDTFAIVSSVDDEIKFTLVMFEFSSSATATEANKLPIYFHATFYMCEVADSSSACTQSCATRKKRDIFDEEPPTQIHTIGPFFPGSPKTIENQNENAKQIGAKRIDDVARDNKSTELAGAHITTYQIYLPSPDMSLLCYWILLVLTTAVILYFILKCFSFTTKPRNTTPWNECMLPNTTKG